MTTSFFHYQTEFESSLLGFNIEKTLSLTQ